MVCGLCVGDFGVECDLGLLYLMIIGFCMVYLINWYMMGVVLGCDLIDLDFLYVWCEDIVGIVLMWLWVG